MASAGVRAWRVCLAVVILAGLLGVVPLGASRILNGCSMTRMRPGYVAAGSWSGYGLVRYVEWGSKTALKNGSAACLFLPGNGGDYKQARSLGKELAAFGIDVFAADFQEELSAFDGRIVEAQARFGGWAVSTLRELGYESVVVVGHSMGGVAALAGGGVGGDAVITLAAPLSGHPAAADRTLARVYDRLAASPPVGAVASVSGGARDWQVPPWLGASPGPPGGSVHVVAPDLPSCSRVRAIDHQCLCWCNELARTRARTGCSEGRSTFERLDLA